MPVNGVRLEDVAAAAGVSTATVSRVLNHSGKVAAKTQQTVLEKVRELGGGAPAVRTLGLIVPDSSNPFFSQLIHLFERELARVGAHLVSASAEGRVDKEIDLIERFRAMKVSGIFYTPTRETGEAVLRLVARGDIPVLAFDRNIPAGSLDCVTTDSRSATQTLIDYLVNLGHREFGYIAGPQDTTTGREREESFAQALALNQLRVSPGNRHEGTFRLPAGRDAAEAYLATDPEHRPTAIVAANDLMAIGFMQRVQDAGLRIPRDVSVSGFDGIEFGAWYFPSLTTISQPVPKLVHEATKLLLRRIEEGSALPPARVSIEPDLLIRNSVGPAPTSTELGPRLVSVSNQQAAGARRTRRGKS